MSAPILDLGDALVALLNAGPFDPALEVERVYELLVDLPQLATPKVTLFTMRDDSPERVSREKWKHELNIQIAVQQKVTTGQVAAMDTCVTLADDIRTFLKANQPDRPEKLTGITLLALYSAELLKQHRIFTSAVSLTYVAHR